jgi:cation diffusion facilitator CzcD-associated flavoprotein CzcO
MNDHVSTGQPSIVVIGAGFAGITMSLRLQEAGLLDFIVLEKGDDVGGVWRENTYPGAACDVPSPLYSISSQPNPDWPRRFSRQPDILRYLRNVAESNSIVERIRFGTEVVAADFDESTHTWSVSVASGEMFTCDVLISAVGQLSQPSIPAVPGAGSFAGPAFHSAQWEHGQDLAGKRISVVGTGASAVQFVPEIVSGAEHVTVFQRSAPWILPKPDRAYTRWHRLAFRRVPAVQGLERLVAWALLDICALALVDAKPIGSALSALSRLHLRLQVRDADLRRKLTPDYAPGCKRALFSNNYYPALTRPNVSVITGPIARIEHDAVIMADGTRHPTDVIIYGTGFAATEFLSPMRITGRRGSTLDAVWAGAAHAFLGMTVPGFPNLFLLYGPNTNVGSGSIVYMLETQAAHIAQLVKNLAARPGHSLEVRPDIERRFNAGLQDRLGRSVWTLCASWYRTATGAIPTNWPGATASYRRRVQRTDPSCYLTAPVGQRSQTDRVDV